MLSGRFKRSSRFGLIGVFVVMALCAAIGVAMGSGEANPKLTLGLIFGLIAVFVVVLLLLQRSDLERASDHDTEARTRAAAESGRPVKNPTAVSEAELWASLAIAPIDVEAVKAQSEMWHAGRRNLKLGAIVVGLIFLTVPPTYLLESLVPLLIGVPLIVVAALFGAFRAIGPGGEINRAYDLTDRAMKPLGLQVAERPQGGFEPRGPAMPGFDYRLRGPTELSGGRHGRRVEVRFGGDEDAGRSEVVVAEPCHEFEVESKQVSIRSGPEGIVVSRRKAQPGDWLCDLWLAERLVST